MDNRAVEPRHSGTHGDRVKEAEVATGSDLAALVVMAVSLIALLISSTNTVPFESCRNVHNRTLLLQLKTN